MTSLQRRLNRSGVLEPRIVACRLAWTTTAAGTRIATVATPPKADVDSEDVVLSVRELPGNGSGAGTALLAAHRHGPPCEPNPPLQQQWHGPFPQQQHLCWVEDTAVPPQQECRVCAPAAQCGHFAAGVASAPPAFNAADCGE